MFIFCSTKKTRQKARDERFKKNLGIYIGDVASREAPNNKGCLVVEFTGGDEIFKFLNYVYKLGMHELQPIFCILNVDNALNWCAFVRLV